MPYLILERPGVRERGGDVEGEQGIRKGGRDKGSQGEGEGGGGGGGRGGGGEWERRETESEVKN